MLQRQFITPFKTRFFSELDFDELTDKRLEIVSKKLLILQQREILKKWKTYIKNVFLKQELFDYDDDMLDEVINDLDKELESEIQMIIEKYKNQYLNDNKELQSMFQETEYEKEKSHNISIQFQKNIYLLFCNCKLTLIALHYM